MTQRLFKIVTLSLLLFASLSSCKKENNPKSLDYTVQAVPDISVVLQGHEDLISAMDSIQQLHFGDQPPQLFGIETNNDTVRGFSGTLIYLDFIPSSSTHIDYNQPNGGDYIFRFYDQHRCLAKLDYENTRPNSNPYLPPTTFYAYATDYVYIMGNADFFTAYLTLKQEMKDTPNSGTSLAVILSGEVRRDTIPNGIKDFHLGYKIIGYDNDPLEQYSHINDIYLYKKDFMPFTYWDPNQTY